MPFRKKSREKSKLRLQTREPLLTPDEKAEFTKYVYPFENLVMEGGGCKGSAYVGTMRVLEEIGVWQNIKRYAGASVGSIVALCGALGYDSYGIEALMSVNMQDIFYDAPFGSVSILPNLKKNYGWHPGKRAYKWIRNNIVGVKLGNPDATFADLYKQTGRELCVVAANVNQMDCEYFHVKTTPDMPLALAVRMSISIPGVFAPVKYNLHGAQELFCDAGLVINYPLHAFDGWYLSMKPDDSFLKRMPDLNDITKAWDTGSKFGTESNKKTFGVLLFAEGEEELFKIQLIERTEKYIASLPLLPETTLAKKYLKERCLKSNVARINQQMSEAMVDFLNLIKEYDLDNSGTIDKEELRTAIGTAGAEFTKEQQSILFGKDVSVDELFDLIDTDMDGEITTTELTRFAEQRGMEIRKLFRGFDSRKIKNVSGYFDAILNTMLLNLMKLGARGDDLHRSIGINACYLGTMDFDMESDDKTYLIQQGKVACMAFLREHLDRHELTERSQDVTNSEDVNTKKNKLTKYFSLRRRSKKIPTRNKTTSHTMPPKIRRFTPVSSAANVGAQSRRSSIIVGPGSRRSSIVGPGSRRSSIMGPGSRRSSIVGSGSQRSIIVGPGSRRQSAVRTDLMEQSISEESLKKLGIIFEDGLRKQSIVENRLKKRSIAEEMGLNI